MTAPVHLALTEATLNGLRIHEAVCARCDRHVFRVNEHAAGFLAPCGNRLSRLDECGKASQTRCFDVDLTCEAQRQEIANLKRRLEGHATDLKPAEMSDR